MASNQQGIQVSAAQPADWIAMPAGMSLYGLSIRILTVLMGFLNNVDIARVDRLATEGMTGQAMMKVGLILVAAVLGGWGWWKSEDVRRLFGTLPGVLFILLGIWYIVTIPFSIVTNVSLSAAVLYWGALLFIMSGIRFVGGTKLLLDLSLGQFLFLVGSVAIYFVNREASLFTEVLGPNLQVVRFGGLGHPNVLGRIAVFLALLLIAGAMQKSISWIWFFLALPLIVLCCVASLSRTPVIAGAVAIAIISIPVLRNPHAIYLAGFGLLALIASFVAFESIVGTDELFAKFVQSGTKTGSIDEVTTMTGRTVIWEFAIERIKESPFFGFGAGCTPVLMASVAGHAHNVILQPTVSIGIPGGALFAAILLWNVYTSVKYDLPLVRIVTIFILTLGVAETPLFNPLPESVSLMWFAISFWPVGQEFDQRNQTTFRRLEEADADPSLA